MRNAGLEEAQAGIKIARRNINHLRYADDTTLMAESEVKSLSRVRLFATPWTVAYQASLSVGLSRQEHWSGLPFPSPAKEEHAKREMTKIKDKEKILKAMKEK